MLILGSHLNKNIFYLFILNKGQHRLLNVECAKVNNSYDDLRGIYYDP